VSDDFGSDSLHSVDFPAVFIGAQATPNGDAEEEDAFYSSHEEELQETGVNIELAQLPQMEQALRGSLT
jgi:hypothetical protein